MLQQDHKIIKLCENHNFLAAEGKYYRTYYEEFTRTPKSLSPNSKELTVNEEDYLNVKNDKFKKSFKYIRSEIIAKAELATLMQLTHVATESRKQSGLEINVSMKKNLRRKIKIQFSASLEIFHKDKGNMVVVPNTVLREKLAIEIVKLQETVKSLTEKDPHKQVGEVVGKLRHQNRTCPGVHLRLNYLLKIFSSKLLTSFLKHIAT